MKNYAIKLVWFCTVFVFAFAFLCQTETPMKYLLMMFLLGNLLIPYMVYTVLTDNYKTNKKFKDWYQDYNAR